MDLQSPFRYHGFTESLQVSRIYRVPSGIMDLQSPSRYHGFTESLQVSWNYKVSPGTVLRIYKVSRYHGFTESLQGNVSIAIHGRLIINTDKSLIDSCSLSLRDKT
jgi:hypothetical protein